MQPNKDPKEVKIQLNQVLHSIINKSTRIINSLIKSQITHKNQNLSFMAAICGIRIIFGRYLALYRWNLSNQTKSIIVENFTGHENIQKSILTTFNFIQPFFKMKPQEIIEKHNQNIFQQKTDKNAHQPLRNEMMSIILSRNTFYNSKTKIFLNKKQLIVYKQNEYQFSIRIKSSGEFKLTHFNIFFPKEVFNLISTKINHMLKKFSAILSVLILKSQNPIESAQNSLHKFYLYGIHFYILNFFISFQDKYNYKCNEINNRNTEIAFPDSFTFSNRFLLSISDTEISILSKSILIDGFYTFNFTSNCSLINEHQIESIISEMQLKVAQTKLEHLWNPIEKSVEKIGVTQFKAFLDLDSISIDFFLYEIYVCTLTVDKMTGKTILTFFNKNSDPKLSFLANYIDHIYRIDYSIRLIFLHSYFTVLCNLYHISVQTDLFNPEFDEHKPFSQLLFFTSTPSIATKISHYEGKPFFVLECFSQIYDFRKFVSKLSVDSLSTVNFSTNKSFIKKANNIKVVSILTQFSQELRNKGISTSIEDKKVIFVIEPFDSVVFKMNSSLYWSLKFIRPSFIQQKSMSFSGNCINSRFVEWLVDLLVNVSALLHLYRQTLYEMKVNNVINSLDFIDISNFRIYFDYNFELDMQKEEDANSILYISLEPISYIQNISDSSMNDSKQTYFQLHHFITPCIQFNFSQFIPLKQQLMTWLKNGQILLLFGSFLKCSLKPLLYFYKLFSSSSSDKMKNNWLLTCLRDDRSFFLIFQRRMSINFTLRPSQIFELTIPSVGKSQMLQIPLEALPRSCHISNFMHPLMRLQINQLNYFKTVIENFFGFQERLFGIGFENFELINGEVVSLFPRQVSYARISCFIRPTYVEFKVEGENEVAQNLNIILNFQFENNETQISIVRIVISLLDFDQKFVTFIMRFMAEMASKTKNFGIDWKKTMDKTNIILSEMKVLFDFFTSSDHFCVELSKNSKESTPQIMCYNDMGHLSRLKSMKELVSWIHKHEKNGS